MSNGVKTTSIDLNTDATTTVYDPSTDATVERVEVPNSGGTAQFDLEVTDGSTTVTLTSSGGSGGAVTFSEPLPLVDGWTLQVDVTTTEGAAETTTAVVFVEGD